MQKLATNLSMLLLLLVTVSCGGGGTAADYSLNGIGFKILDAGTLVTTSSSIQGTGTILMAQPLTNEDNNFAIRYSLAPQGQLVLVPNASETLEGPISLTLRRSASDALEIVLKDGANSYNLHEDLNQAIPATAAINMEIDVHGHGHLVIWVNGMEEEFAFSSEVSGNYWGLDLTDATVLSAQSGPAKEEH